MSESPMNTFLQSLSENNISAIRTTPSAFEGVLLDVIDGPAVGSELPFEGVSLTEMPVTLNPTSAQLHEARTGVTPVGIGVASRGTIVVQSRPEGDEPISVYPERHVAVVHERDIVPNLAAALDWLGDEFAAGRDTAVLATGVSATGDMGALVHGVHGPKDVNILIIEDEHE